MTRDELLERLRKPGPAGLWIEPLLDEDQIGEVTTDLRLGYDFLVSIMTRRSLIAPPPSICISHPACPGSRFSPRSAMPPQHLVRSRGAARSTTGSLDDREAQGPLAQSPTSSPHWASISFGQVTEWNHTGSVRWSQDPQANGTARPSARCCGE